MDNKNNLISTIVLILLILVLPVAVYLIGQRVELRKRAAAIPAFDLNLNQNEYDVNEDIIATLLLRTPGLEGGKFDAADFVITHNSNLELISSPKGNPFSSPSGGLNENLEYFKNEIADNKILLTVRAKEVGGTRQSFTPPSDNFPIAQIKFKAASAGTGQINFDENLTVVAVNGINTTNFDAEIVNKSFTINEGVLLKVTSVDPSFAIAGYSNVTLTVNGTGFEQNTTVKIGSHDCTNVTFTSSSQLTCSLPDGLTLGEYNVTVTNPDNTTDTLQNGFQVVDENAPQLTLNIKFFRVDKKPATTSGTLDYQHQKVKVIITGTDRQDIKYQNDAVIFTAQDNGVFINETPIAAAQVTAGDYKIFIKGPRHLQKRFVKQLTAGAQTIDLTQVPLPGGDLAHPGSNNAQDGEVNSLDFTYVADHFDSSDENVLEIADMNLDGVINPFETSIIVETLSKKLDEDE